MNEPRISNFQLGLLISGFIFGTSVVINVLGSAQQDAWLAYLIAWSGSFILMGLYIIIANLNPDKTLIEILQVTFGKYLGSIVAILYIWYFTHLAAINLRNIGEYSTAIVYPETPLIFVITALALLIAYATKNGLEVIARISELFVPISILLSILVLFLLIPLYDINNLLPFLEYGWIPILKTSFSVLTFPFGELVVFLMIFPFSNKKDNLLKTTYLSITTIGFILLLLIIAEIMALGADMFARATFPPAIFTKVVPYLDIDSIINVVLLIGGAIKIIICLYGAVMGVTQLINLHDYKPYVLPMLTIVITTAIWIYDNVFVMFKWSRDIYPYYALPFQIIIPILILIISGVKKRLNLIL
ncbi:GerAB/ArcD/ProY family transporter [Halanaerobaculum tunisiense]